MARTKRMNINVHRPVMTWTRFLLPPHQEWPTWPCNLSEPSGPDVQTGPLGNRPDVRAAYVGRMVEDSAQAVFAIDWQDRKSLDAFLASPACDEFLRLLPEEVALSTPRRNERPQAPPQERRGNSESDTINGVIKPLEVRDESSSAPSPPSSRSRFLILNPRPLFRYAFEIKDRITLTAFLVPVDKPEDPNRIFSNITATVGDGRFMPEYVQTVQKSDHFFVWMRCMPWFSGSAVGCGDGSEVGGGDEDDAMWSQRLERTLLGERGVHVHGEKNVILGQTVEEEQGPSHYLLCEVTEWHEIVGNEEVEEKVANDVEFNREWQSKMNELKAGGMIRAWKRERWDIWPCPGFVLRWRYSRS